MNLRFDHNLCSTSTHFIGRNQLCGGASAQSERKQKWATRWSLEATGDHIGGRQRIEDPITEAKEQWTCLTLWSIGHKSSYHSPGVQIIVNAKGL
jgi:hypothetical protein